jgi:hypothetical protein
MSRSTRTTALQPGLTHLGHRYEEVITSVELLK